jgi:hypothetical protein
MQCVKDYNSTKKTTHTSLPCLAKGRPVIFFSFKSYSIMKLMVLRMSTTPDWGPWLMPVTLLLGRGDQENGGLSKKFKRPPISTNKSWA